MQIDVWQFVGGIGLFLFAMSQLELALKQIAGRPLKVFLRQHTNNSLKSVLIGSLSTAVVQSSSLVGLMVLAFVGAGVMSLQNALGVIFGANLGTTVTGWVVATLGFKLDLSAMALPLVGIGSLLLVIGKGRAAESGRIVLAIGFLLMGIDLMKASVDAVTDLFDVARLKDLGGWQYLLFGVVFAAIVQSSSAAMMVTLAALHSGMIALPAAAAIAIGADLGTTTTVMLGAVKGEAGKKRVALAHLIFNTATAIFAFALLAPLLGAVRSVGIHDPLFSLVAFHSLFNFLGIVVFLPIMKPFARFLGQRFSSSADHESIFVGETVASVSDVALDAIAKEAAHIIARVVEQNLRVFEPPLPTPAGVLPVPTAGLPDTDSYPYDELYRRNKRLEGEIINFALRVQAEPVEPVQSERLNRLLSSVRHAVHSAKSLRDVRHNLEEFADSAVDEVHAYLDRFRSIMTEFYGKVYRLRSGNDAILMFQDSAYLMKRIQEWHDLLHREIYADIRRGHLADNEISSLMNVNRETLNSNVALADALRDFSLQQTGAEAPSAPAAAI